MTDGDAARLKSSRWLCRLLCSLAFVCGLMVSGCGSHITDPYGYTHWLSNASGRCLDVLSESALPGAAVDQLTCRNAKSQEWTQIEAATVADHRPGGCNCVYNLVQIQNHNGGNCMAVADDSGKDGTRVIQAVCDKYDQKQWWHFGPSNVGGHSYIGGGAWAIVNWTHNQCLDLENGEDRDEVPMQVWTCNLNTLNQSWASIDR